MHRWQKVASLCSLVFFLLLVAGNTPALGKQKYKRTVEFYSIPDVTLINQDGKKIVLKELLNSDKPVLIDFIYATCTTICPVLSAGFSNLQKRLGPEREQVRLISISIDPDNDRPDIMKQYLARYQAKSGWDFLTGDRDDIVQVMRAFDAFVENKMSHYPLTILHTPGAKEWIRIYGMLGTTDLMGEYKRMLKQ